MFLVWKQTYLRGKFNCTISSVILKQGELRRNKTFLLCMYFYITLHCIGYSPSIPLSRHQGPTILYYPPSLGPIPLLRVPSSSYSLLLTASLYDPVSGSNRWNPCTHVHPCQGLWAHGVSRVVSAQRLAALMIWRRITWASAMTKSVPARRLMYFLPQNIPSCLMMDPCSKVRVSVKIT